MDGQVKRAKDGLECELDKRLAPAVSLLVCETLCFRIRGWGIVLVFRR